MNRLLTEQRRIVGVLWEMPSEVGTFKDFELKLSVGSAATCRLHRRLFFVLVGLVPTAAVGHTGGTTHGVQPLSSSDCDQDEVVMLR